MATDSMNSGDTKSKNESDKSSAHPTCRSIDATATSYRISRSTNWHVSSQEDMTQISAMQKTNQFSAFASIAGEGTQTTIPARRLRRVLPLCSDADGL